MYEPATEPEPEVEPKVEDEPTVIEEVKDEEQTVEEIIDLINDNTEPEEVQEDVITEEPIDSE